MMKVYAEPHFDDEQTIRAARPVVPLEKINAEVRKRRQWFLGGAFAIAMMLGAASALVASYLKLRNAPQTASAEVLQEPIESAPLAVVEAAPTDPPVVEDQDSEVSEESEEVTTPPETPKREAALRHRTVAPKHDAEPIEQRNSPALSEAEELQRIRQAVLYDEWQERRARRVRRERRRAERYNHRDLSNLNEIFEGRRP